LKNSELTPVAFGVQLLLRNVMAKKNNRLCANNGKRQF
jgi:hypothetical protein